MKGLILKDLFLFRTYIAHLIFLLIVLSIIEPSLIPVVFAMVITIFFLDAFRRDRIADWDIYLSALPVSSKGLVGSKYIELVLAFLFLYTSSICVAFIEYVNTHLYIATLIKTSLLLPGSMVLVLAVWLPFLFKFRVPFALSVSLSCIFLVAVFYAASRGVFSILMNSPLASTILTGFIVTCISISYFFSIRCIKLKKG